jgi:hypothetical protein
MVFSFSTSFPDYLLIPVIAFILGLLTAYLFFRQQISAIEGRVRETISNAGSSNSGVISGMIPSTARVQH